MPEIEGRTTLQPPKLGALAPHPSMDGQSVSLASFHGCQILELRHKCVIHHEALSSYILSK